MVIDEWCLTGLVVVRHHSSITTVERPHTPFFHHIVTIPPMANKWQYPRWRRATMQATMWVFFGITLAAAAMVSNHRKTGSYSLLANSPGVFRMPAGWVEQKTDPNEPSVKAQYVEPRTEGFGRSVTVRVFQSRRSVTALAFLRSQGLPVELLPPGASDPSKPEEARLSPVAGVQGYLTGGPFTDPSIGLIRRTYYATAALPDRVIVLVSFEAFGPVEPDDLQLLAYFAAHVGVTTTGPNNRDDSTAEQSTQTTSGIFTLPSGVQIGVPEGYTLDTDRDPLRTGAALVSRSARVELSPCITTPANNDLDRAALAELHDAAFHGATVTETPTTPDAQGNARMRQWVIRPPAPARGDPPLPLTAYLLADRTTGVAVLAVFIGEPKQSADFEKTWAAMASRASFDGVKSASINALVANGERAARWVVSGGVRKLVTSASGGEDTGDAKQSWMMFGDAPEDQLSGWSTQRVTVSAKGWEGTRQWRMRQPHAAVANLKEQWGDTNAMNGYWRISEIPGETGRAHRKQYVRMESNRFTIDSSRDGFSRTTTRPLPRNFVPGPWLVMALGAFANDQAFRPILVSTDTFPGIEPTLADGLVSILIEPDPQAVSTRPVNEDEPPLRALRIAVNGSGEFARWYFTPDGQVKSIDLPGAMHRRVTDEREIIYNFRDDQSMTPEKGKTTEPAM